MSYAQAHQALAETIARACPNGMPQWLGWGIGGLSLIAIGIDVWTMKQANKPRLEGPTLEEKIAEFYYQKAAEISRPLNLTVNVGGAPGEVQTSRYMMEEGNTDIKTDCFSCAIGHVGSTKKAIERAQENMQGNTCGNECRKWLNVGAQETASLLAKDWTDDKINAQPEKKREILEKYRVEVRGVMTDMLGGSEQAQLINEAAGLLDESLRFTNAGDPLSCPDVDSRLKDAEASLAAAERMDIAAYDTETANQLRTVRQAVGSKVNTPDDLKHVRTQARELADKINQQVFKGIDKGKIVDLHKRTAGIYDGFNRERQSFEKQKEIKGQKVEYIREGLIKHAV